MRATAPVSSAHVEIDATALRAARQDCGENQTTLAARVGMSRSYLCQLESGERPRVSPRLFLLLCAALKVQPEQLRKQRTRAA